MADLNATFQNVLVQIKWSQYWPFYVLGVCVLLFFYLMRRKSEGMIKAVNRPEIERLKFIERMDFNVARSVDWLEQGGRTLAYITRIQRAHVRVKLPRPPEPQEEQAELSAPAAAAELSPDGNPIKQVKKEVKKKVRAPDQYLEQDVVEMVCRKLARIPIFGWRVWFFGHPLPFGIGLSRPEGFVFLEKNLSIDPAWPKDIKLNPEASAWLKEGIFYDQQILPTVQAAFVREFLAQTEYESYSSDVYATLQEASVVTGGPEAAIAALTHHLEIKRIEAEKKRQQLSTG